MTAEVSSASGEVPCLVQMSAEAFFSNCDIATPAVGLRGKRTVRFDIRSPVTEETTLDSRCLASPAPSLTVTYPLTSVDWIWSGGGMAEMERAEGKGGNEGLYKEEAALDGNWLRLAP